MRVSAYIKVLARSEAPKCACFTEAPLRLGMHIRSMQVPCHCTCCLTRTECMGRWARIGGRAQASAAAGPGSQPPVPPASEKAALPAAASNGKARARAIRLSCQHGDRPLRGDCTPGARADASTTACVTATEAKPQALSKEQAIEATLLPHKGAGGGQLGSAGACTASTGTAAEPQPDPGPSDTAGDYYVPWHVPFHRVEAALVAGGRARDPHPGPDPDPGPGCLPPAARAVHPGEAADVLQCKGSGDPHACGLAGQNPTEGMLPAAWAVDREKGAVVLQRYCHLYGPGELEALVQAVAGARVASSCYDRSNWCVVMQVG